MIETGTIITISWDKYIPYPGGSWDDHFYRSTKNLIVTRSENNNGNMLAKDKIGRVFHVNRREIISTITRR